MGKVDSKERTESNAMRKKLLEERAIYECCNCGKKLTKEEVQVHHVVPLSLGGTNRESNMVIICLECHGKIHGRKMNTSELTKQGMKKAKLNGKQIGAKKGVKLKTKKSIVAKEQIQKYSKDFQGTLSDAEVMKIIGVSRNSYYKYKKELKSEEGQ